MTITTIIFAGILVTWAVYTWVTIWSRRETFIRTAAVMGFMLLTVFIVPMWNETLGWPKPLWGAWQLQGTQTILSYKFIPGEAIYLYVDGSPEPISVVMPWSERAALKIQDARKGSQDNGDRSGKFFLDFDWTIIDGLKPLFHTIPIPAQPPPKPKQWTPGTYNLHPEYDPFDGPG